MWRQLETPTDNAAPRTQRTVETRRGQRVAVAETARGVWVGFMGGASLVPHAAPTESGPVAKHARRQAATGRQSLRAPMAGRIVAQHASVGVRCRKGEILVVLEAMKMEYRIAAPADGEITACHGAPGDAVGLDAVLVTLVCDARG